MSKPLEDMTYNELRAERQKYSDGQKTVHSDFSWWGFQGDIDRVDATNEQLFKETMKHVYARYGINKTMNYLRKLEDARAKSAELEKAKGQL